MKNSDSAWDERVAKERPNARSQPKFPWQVRPSESSDQDRPDRDQLDQRVPVTGTEKAPVTGTEKAPVTGTEKAPVTGTEKAPVTGTEKAPVTGTEKAPVTKNTTGIKKVTDTEKAPVATFRIPHQELDYIFRKLDAGEFKLYLRLFRLSHGWGQETCKIGDNNLMETLNMSKNALRSAKRGLINKKLIEVIQIVNLGPRGFTEYRVLPAGEEKKDNWYQKGTSSEKVTDTKKDPIKERSDDHLKQDHQTRARAKKNDDDFSSHITDHQKKTQKLYEKFTGNGWQKGDGAAYQKIKDVDLEKIEQAIRLATQRSSSRPNSLNYFVKEILNLAHPSQQSRTQHKKALEKIVRHVREIHVGGNYSIADFVEDVKRACAREGVGFNNDLFNEIMAKR